MKIKEKYENIAKEATQFKTFVQEKWSIAIALVVALAVKNLVKSLVGNILSPLFIYFLKGKSIYESSYQLTSSAAINYGHFLQEFTIFIILMLLVYLASRLLKIQSTRP